MFDADDDGQACEEFDYGNGGGNENDNNAAYAQYDDSTITTQDQGNDDLMDAGGPVSGPAPPMSGSGCPVERDGACFAE